MEYGLRQGDPLSPFLLFLVVDILGKILHRVVSIGLIEGVTIGRHHVNLSHLQFVDDTLLLFDARKDVLVNLRIILDYFSVMSGLCINFDKSALIPLNCEESLVEEMKSSLQCKVLSLPITYLRIPLRANPRRSILGIPLLRRLKRSLAVRR